MHRPAGMVTRLVARPARTLLFRPGAQADDYFSYCAEFGGDAVDAAWAMLMR